LEVADALAFGISSRLLSVGGRSALAFGISSRLSQLEVADALAFGISSRLFLLEVADALALAFGSGSLFFLLEVAVHWVADFLFQSRQRDRRRKRLTLPAPDFAPKKPLSPPPLVATVVCFLSKFQKEK
jgi:hypothetical protein